MRSLPLFALAALAALSACAPPAGGAGLTGGRALAEGGNYDAAITLADTAIARNPSDAEGYILRSDARRRKINADSVRVDSVAVFMALSDAQRAAALAPENVNARNALSNFWITAMNNGARAYGKRPPDFAGARVLFRAATLAKPDSAQSLVNYGLAEYASGNPLAAATAYRAAIRIEPNDPETQRRLGRALIEGDNGTEAVSVLEAASTQFPRDAAIRADLFAAYEATGRGAQALARYETELRNASPADEPAMRLQYGVALLQANRVDDAIRELTRAAELSPNDATAQYNLGAAIQNKGARLNTEANAATDNAENARLVRERNAALESSIPYFERARTLSSAGDDQRGACTALFRVYTTLGRTEDAQGVLGLRRHRHELGAAGSIAGFAVEPVASSRAVARPEADPHRGASAFSATGHLPTGPIPPRGFPGGGAPLRPRRFFFDQPAPALSTPDQPDWGFATRAVHAGQHPDPSTGAIMTPVYLTSTYVQSAPGEHRGHEYSRVSNPTRSALEGNLASLEGATEAVAFASGVAATDAILRRMRPGDHVVASNDLYGGSYRLMRQIHEPMGVRFSFVDLSDLEAAASAITEHTTLVFAETPTNPLLRITDIAALAEITRARGVTLVVDNTFASPYLQNPLALGADLVVHSTTKYIGGHSDVGPRQAGRRSGLASSRTSRMGWVRERRDSPASEDRQPPTDSPTQHV